MGQIPEGRQKETMGIAFGVTEDDSLTVCVYGHGPSKNPFYEEAHAVRANSEGGLLILGAAVNCGQRLLLINNSGQNPVEAHVVNTRTMGAQMYEVEIAFPTPRPNFWQPLRASEKRRELTDKRRFPRMTLPCGMSIAWQANKRRDISRVTSLSLGGLFIEVAEPARVGDALQVQFDIPGGAVHAKAIVRRSIKGKGMGVEFTELPASARAGLHQLMQKLLGDVRTAK